jgi:hypothetical protein
MTKIERIRKQSVYDEWEPCICCNQPASCGYNIYDEDTPGIITICDDCLQKARSSKSRWIENGNIIGWEIETK